VYTAPVILLVARALGSELPWECPAVSTPEEAEPLDDDFGIDAVIDEVAAAIDRWWDGSCSWTVTVDEDGTATSTCTTDAGADLTWVQTEVDESFYTGASDDVRYEHSETWEERRVTVPEGSEAWSELSWESREESTWGSGYSDRSGSHAAAWTGSFASLPDDGWASASAANGWVDAGCTYDEAVYQTPSCAWSWEAPDFICGGPARRRIAEVEVEVYAEVGRCGGYPIQAYVNGTLFGHVDYTTWALDEADMDGWSVDAGDCDDTDPAINPCAEDIPLDGIDQDCDGRDAGVDDLDGDGFDWTGAGGDDCGDEDATVYPGAPEVADDGIDQDCDGHDDADADGDGFTADGDDGPADCDDTDPAVYPGAPEVADDGIDQDCDGEDLTPGDTGAEEGGTEGGAEDTASCKGSACRRAPEEDGAASPGLLGCAVVERRATGAALIVVVVGALRRRARR
jgi:hypothetical protein